MHQGTRARASCEQGGAALPRAAEQASGRSGKWEANSDNLVACGLWLVASCGEAASECQCLHHAPGARAHGAQAKVSRGVAWRPTAPCHESFRNNIPREETAQPRTRAGDVGALGVGFGTENAS